MNYDEYSTIFDEVVVKVLTAADLNSSKCHQHEFNGVAKLKKWFFGQKTDIKTKFIQLDDKGNVIWSDDSLLTWYNVREKTLGREEFRMYYHKSVIFSHFDANDLIVILFKLASGIPEALMISVTLNSTASKNIAYLLKITKTTNLPPVYLERQNDEEVIRRIITLLDGFLVDNKQSKKQSTKERSAEIRSKIDLTDIISNPDRCLAELYEAERNNNLNFLPGYYEQLSIILIRNGVFFDYIKENGTVIGLNLGTFNNKRYCLFTCDDDISLIKNNQNDCNYCVLLDEKTAVVMQLKQKGINPIILNHTNNTQSTLLSFIREINSIQRGE